MDLFQHSTEKLIETYQLDVSPIFRSEFVRMGGTELAPQGHFIYHIDKWEVRCWPKRLKGAYGATLREAVENAIKEIS